MKVQGWMQLAATGGACLLVSALAAPGPAAAPAGATVATSRPAAHMPASMPSKRQFLVAHVFVALCDNANQGIVKVPASLGNGQEPAGNLYWGAMYGVRTFLKKSPHWHEQFHYKPPAADKSPVLERAGFVSAVGDVDLHVVADAYDGARMKDALEAFLSAAAGKPGTDQATFDRDGNKLVVPTGGGANMVCFVGHNGLMDVKLEKYPEPAGATRPGASVVLACKSRDYFAEPLRTAGSRALVLTSGLMAPEAYTLDESVRSWAVGEGPDQTRARAAAVYARYQKCPLAAARKLFVGSRE